MRLAFLVLWVLVPLALGALAGGAAAEDEVEPNNSSATATPLAMNNSAYGNLTNASDRDFWVLNTTGPGGLQLFLQCSSPGCPTIRVSDANNSTLPLYEIDTSRFGGFYNARHYGGGPLWVELSMDHDGLWYTFNAHFASGLGWEGADEAEPNDAPENATDFGAVPVRLEGRAAGGYGDVDWWRVDVAANGWAKVVLTLEEQDIALGTPFVFEAFVANASAAGISTGNASLLVVQVTAGVPLLLRINTSDNSLPYSIRVSTRPLLVDFTEGASEFEPNNVEADATLLSANTSGHATLDGELDRVDTFRILAPRGSVVRLAVDAVYWWYMPRLSLTIGGVPLAFIIEPGSEEPDTGFALFLVTNASESIVFSVSAIFPEDDYTFQLNISATAVLDDGELSLDEVDAVPDIGLWLSPVALDFRPDSFDIGNGDKTIFGESFCAHSNLTRQVAEVRITAGRLLAPDNASLVRFVIARSALIPLYVDYPSCFRAFVYDQYGSVGDDRDRYHTAGILEGDAAKVMAAITATNRTDGTAYLAFRAGLYNVTEDEARAFHANSNQIRDARAMLDAAGVVVPLNAPAAPPAQVPNLFGLELGVVLAVAAAAAILAVAAFRGRIRNRPNNQAIRDMWGAPEKPVPKVLVAREVGPPGPPIEPPKD